MLIYKQKQDTSWVTGLKARNKLGGQVNTNAESIRNVAPRKAREIELDVNEEIEKEVIKGLSVSEYIFISNKSGVESFDKSD